MNSSSIKSEGNLLVAVPATDGGARVLRSRTMVTFVWFWGLLGGLYLIPGPVRQILRRTGTKTAAMPAPPGSVVTARPARPLPPEAPVQVLGGSPPQVEGNKPSKKLKVTNTVEPIQDPHGSMKHFYDSLRKTAKGGSSAVTRVLHYGDSLIDLDRITGPLRQLLQRRYGNAGRGFVLAGKPWRWYRQDGINIVESPKSWTHLRVVGGRSHGGRLGLGYAAFDTRNGKQAWVSLSLKAEATGSKLHVLYHKRPAGGLFQVTADEHPGEWIKTASDKSASGYHHVKLQSSPRKIRIRARGKVRLFGVILEREGPGITWENLPMVGTRFHHLVKINAEHWIDQLRHRKPHLVVFQYGANDTISYGGDLERYGNRVLAVLKRVRKAMPRSSCMVVGPLDRVQKDSHGRLRSPRNVLRVKGKQMEVAHAAGCAFWDSQMAMGGRGSMKRWARTGKAIKDYVHLTPAGSRSFAALLDRALHEAFRRNGGK